MRSTDLFERPSRAVKPRKPIGLVAILSLILPGTGHVLLGRAGLGLALLTFAVLAVPASILARSVLPETAAPLAWLVGRLGVLAALFSVLDAPARAREPKWSPVARNAIPPRHAAAWNAAFYGVGLWKLDERASAWIAILFGGAAHVGLVLWLPANLTLLAELVPLGAAFWGYRLAEEIGAQRGRVLADDDDPTDEPKRRPLAPLPGWVVPTQAFVVTLLVVSGVVVWISHAQWLSARAVDRGQAVAQEPFYRNPAYGLELEMGSPGWTFREDDPALFLDAVHIGHKSRFQVRLQPRIPGRDGPAIARSALREALEENGLAVLSLHAESVDGEAMVRLYGRAVRGSQAREVAGLCAVQGFRRYLIHMEWDPDHADFGSAEWNRVVAGLRIEDRDLPTEAPTPAR